MYAPKTKRSTVFQGALCKDNMSNGEKAGLANAESCGREMRPATYGRRRKEESLLFSSEGRHVQDTLLGGVTS